MFKDIKDLLTPEQVATLRAIAERSTFVDGRISNPHHKSKRNEQAHQTEASELLSRALMAHEDFRNFAFPARIAPPILTRYGPGMRYGWHADSAFLATGAGTLRGDLSCTIFLSDPASYSGGALAIRLGDVEAKFRGRPGSAIVYPSHTFHQVEPVTAGSRLVGLTFIQSQIANAMQRETLYELNEVTALEGLKMEFENYARLQLVSRNLMQAWADRA